MTFLYWHLKDIFKVEEAPRTPAFFAVPSGLEEA